MKWEIFIPAKDAGSMQTTVTVEAKNWFSALNTGLKQVGEKDDVASNLLCDVRDDGSIHVTDVRNRRVFQIRSVEELPKESELPPAERTSFLESKSAGRPSGAPAGQPPVQESFMESEVPPTPSALAEHKIFFSRDENPTSDSNLVYRERLIAAAGTSERADLESLLLHYFETLRRNITPIEGARYINLAVYPTEFKGRPPGPPTGALSWQDWKDREPQVSFPMTEPAMVETSYIPPETVPPADAAQPPAAAPQQPPVAPVTAAPQQPPEAPATAAPQQPPEAPATAAPQQPPAAQPAQPPAPEPALAGTTPAGPPAQAAPQPEPQVRRRTPSQQMQIGRDLKRLDTAEILAEVFEEMQDLYMTQDQEQAAEFALSLAMKKISAEAGSVFLADINTRELYFAAVAGPTAEKLKGQRLMITRGIVGFAARRGAAIAISDVRKDPRFCNEFDSGSDFVTKSVVCAPVQYEGRSFGAIEILNRKGGDSFSQGEVNIISYIATQLAEYIATSLPSAEPDFDDEEEKKATTLKPGAKGTKKKGRR